MKQIAIFLCVLLGGLLGINASAVPYDRQALLSEIHAEIDAQQVEDLDEAARQQLIRELSLNSAQRKEFETLYDAYRADLNKALKAVDENATTQSAQRQSLKAKLGNISATAQVKHDYVDRFAAILSAEQIRRLYNTEGQIAANIKTAAANRSRTHRSNDMIVINNDSGHSPMVEGSNRLVSRDWGNPGSYIALSAGCFIEVTISATATSITVTAPDNLIDRIKMGNEGGKLSFTLEADRIRNITGIHITVPASSKLAALSAQSYASISCSQPLVGPDIRITASSYGSIYVPIASNGHASINVSSYGSYSGSVHCNDCNYNLSSYGSAKGAIDCRANCELLVSSYSSFTDPVKAATLNLNISAYGSVKAPVYATSLNLVVNSFASFKGPIAATSASLNAHSSASISGNFSASKFDAKAGSNAKITLNGAAKVESGTVVLSANSSFIASQLRVDDYEIQAGSNSSATVWCAEKLSVEASSSAKVNYNGPCRVESQTENIRKVK